MSSTTADASAKPPNPAADEASAETENKPATSCHTNPMAHVQNTGFHRSRAAAAAKAFTFHAGRDCLSRSASGAAQTEKPHRTPAMP